MRHLIIPSSVHLLVSVDDPAFASDDGEWEDADEPLLDDDTEDPDFDATDDEGDSEDDDELGDEPLLDDE